MDKKTIRDIEVAGKTVLVRVDFNVPRSKETGEITNKSMGTNSKTKTKILSFFFMLIFFAPFDFITH